jgi:hypothetical protein
MFNLNIDKAFNIKRSQLDYDFYLQKQIMSFSEVEDYCKNYHEYESYYVLLNRIDNNSFDGLGYTYKNGEPFKKVQIRVHTGGLGFEEYYFDKNYEGKLVKLDKILSMRPCHYRSDEDDIGAVVLTVDDIYTEHDWQNHLVLLKLESDWLQPDDF